jgi:hypothetical protein
MLVNTGSMTCVGLASPGGGQIETRESQNTQPPGFRFRALLTASGAPTVQLHSS